MSERAPFTEARRRAWLKLWRSENIGPRSFMSLLKRFGSAEAALEALPDLVGRSGRPVRIASDEAIDREIEASHGLGVRFIALDEPEYPSLLREIDSPPAVIALRGNAAALAHPAVAIVGARNASAAGLVVTERFARGLGQAGYVVVSGFARGIDARAHRASLAKGTIAVLPGGHGKIYPSGQEAFLEQLLETGAAISEMPFDYEARGRDFPRRNRIVSGLSLGVIVVEAARRSGSLITANFAADQGREVMAVPGSPLDPRAEGTNDLLREGATFCFETEHVLAALASRNPTENTQRDFFAEREPLWDEAEPVEQGAARPVPTLEAAPELIQYAIFDESDAGEPEPANGLPVIDRILDKLGPAPISIDELGRAAELPARDVRAALLELELAGRLERHGGGLVSLIMG